MLKETFEGKKVFLTGHTGFKGAWLLLILHKLGAQIKGYSLAPKHDNDLYNLIGGDSLCTSVIADIRDRERVQKEVDAFQPDFVFHLAAQALVIDSYTIPVETYETNVMGTIYVLDALRGLKKPCTSVMITTDKVYENFETTEPYPEDARLGGYDPYSNSKACAELAISSYRNSFLNPKEYPTHLQSLSSARSGNVIGGGDWSENRLVPDIARALIAGEQVIIRNPSAVRPWQHVLDPLNGYLMLAAHMAKDPLKFAQGYNFGPYPNDERNVEDMCGLAIEQWGEGSYQTPDIPEKPHEAGLLKLAIDKAKRDLQWEPRFTSAEAVEWTIDWYKNGRDDALNFTSTQIERYFGLG
ncbi:MAG: CDP-glucose 4,6-dehydratase [Flavobacteriales bacterium]|nr:CDP-glucose 4,6-dehydratase [Flavobacteriales bacterium]